MEQKEFNPIIEAVVSIRQYALSISENWTSMKSMGAVLKEDMDKATGMVNMYGSETTKQQWASEIIDFNATKSHLEEIMRFVISRIKEKSTEGLSARWNDYPGHVSKMEASYEKMKSLGQSSLPENKKDDWGELWNSLMQSHGFMGKEANAIGIQLGLMEKCTPDEIDELSDTILKHIPSGYSIEEAHKYTDEYMDAYEQLKTEAYKKKNLWDRFLDVLAGGTQQTPAQRVMMQRWVDGEKGDAH
ncbi:hypothetical protein [Flagellimonas myxillae]|uniref:hypothetical protein n=1 Tax=Flagellimonas myxillae TaxID=2942214 RepID=UPI00201EC64D|nr:hypothetical protein [Muricauda myxillae]MCL6266564.1 hypothetical protein [Muricauda myxillae]